MTMKLMLPEPNAAPLPAVMHALKAIFVDRYEILKNDDLDILDSQRRVAGAIEKLIATQEGRPTATHAARILEAAVGQALGPATQGQRTDKLPLASGSSQISDDDRYRFRLMAEWMDLWLPVLEECETEDKPLTRAKVLQLIEDARNPDPPAPEGVFDVIVIDPPWPIERIERAVRPNQSALDYPTMDEDELATLELPAAPDCHLWLWTTHKFMPMAFRLLDTWGFNYVCTFVWHKPGGFQPVGLPQYNCEFALYARRGAPMFADTKAFSTAFEAPRTEHSAKPDKFYEIVRRVTAGQRLDMFNRRVIEGFDGWGKEAVAA